MLTSDLAISRRRGKRVEPHFIAPTDVEYLQVASDLISIIAQGVGLRRAEVNEMLHDYIGTGTDYRILRGLIKLLMDRCDFATATAADPVEIRRALFTKARAHHPVSNQTVAREGVIAEVAAAMNCSPEDVMTHLYADLPDNQRLQTFDEPAAADLLDAYNLAQAQALLYRSVEMRLWIEPQDSASYRRLFAAIKAHRLIHSISGSANAGYEITLTGPVAMFHRSQKYGIQMAVFLPALLSCKGWRMRAEIESKYAGGLLYELDSRDGRLRADDLNLAMGNPLAEKLKASWEKTASEWALAESREVIDLGDSAFVPDFVLTHKASSRRVYLEVIGFWTPRFLQERLAEFERGRFTDFILVVSEELRGSRENPTTLPANVLVCKTSLTAKDVLSMLPA